MKMISGVIALCDELIASAKKLHSEELRREIEEYANGKKHLKRRRTSSVGAR